MRQVTRQPDLEECVEVSDKEQQAVQTKIKALLEKVGNNTLGINAHN